MTFGGVYKARCLTIKDGVISAEIPQVFGKTVVTFSDATGALPDPGVFGYVLFESGQAERPVWLSA